MSDEDRRPAYYEGQDRGTAPKRGDEDRRPAYYAGQDWTTVTIKKTPNQKKQTSSEPKSILKKSTEGAHMYKLETMETAGKVKRLSSESKQEMITKRVANGWNQQALNQQCGFPLNTVRDIEAGKFVPTPGQLNTLNKVLRASLHYEK